MFKRFPWPNISETRSIRSVWFSHVNSRPLFNFKPSIIKTTSVLFVMTVRKSTFQYFTADWNFNVVEMTLKTLHFVQGLPRTPLLFFFDISTSYFFKNKCMKSKSARCSNFFLFKNIFPGSLTGAQPAFLPQPLLILSKHPQKTNLLTQRICLLLLRLALDLSPNGTPWKLRGFWFWQDASRSFYGACVFV